MTYLAEENKEIPREIDDSAAVFTHPAAKAVELRDWIPDILKNVHFLVFRNDGFGCMIAVQGLMIKPGSSAGQGISAGAPRTPLRLHKHAGASPPRNSAFSAPLRLK